ncbi:MAG: protein kinase [Thermoanaerobaculales bacterium]
MRKDVEEQLLEELVRRDLLSLNDLDAVEEASHEDLELTLPPCRWGLRIALLIKRGFVDESTVHEVAEEILDEAALRAGVPSSTPAPKDDRGSAAPECAPKARPIREVPAFLGDWERYTDLEFLGEGGMARVFKGFDPRIERYVALKFLRDDDPSMVERFLTEARAQARVEHEYVCKIYEVGEIQERPFIAMQFVDGGNLGQEAKNLDRGEILLIMSKVARAVHAAHEQGLVHRDIKPANIMIERSPEGVLKPYVVDFGLAREQAAPGQTVTGYVLGTPGFMAPEQAGGRPVVVDARTDIYALGATLYYLISGRPPFEGSVLQVLAQMIEKEVVPLRKSLPDVPADLDTIILKCLEKDPADRYLSAEDLASEIKCHLKGEPILANPPSLGNRLGRRVRRHRVVALVIVASMVIVGAFAGLSATFLRRSRHEAELSHSVAQEIPRLEEITRLTRLKPIHDIRKELDRVRTRLQEIEKDVFSGGAGSVGPGHYALARGYLALRDFDAAQRHLDLAWRDGYRRPEVAFATGLTMVNIYRRELARAERLGDRGSVERRRMELDAILLMPAKEFLDQGREAEIESPEYVEALIQFLQRQYGPALAGVDLALKRIPYLYVAHALAGDVHEARAREAFERGDFEYEQAELDRADQRFLEVVRAAPSDPLGHLGLCRVARDRMVLEGEIGGSPEASFQAALAHCERSLTIDPDTKAALHARALVYLHRADYLGRRGQDSSEALATTVSLAKSIIAEDPNDGDAHAYLGISYRRMAQQRAARGDSPEELLGRSAEHLQTAIDLSPSSELALNNLGLTYFYWGFYAFDAGVDPRPAVDQAVKAFTRLLDLRPESMSAMDNMGVARWLAARHEVRWGVDPRPSLVKADSILRQATEANPRDIVALNNLCLVHGETAAFNLLIGIDPTSELDLAESACRSVTNVNPDDPFVYTNLGEVQRLRAAWLVASGTSPEHLLAEARKTLETAREANPTDPEPWLVLARVERVAAEWRKAQSESPLPFLRTAADKLQSALDLNPEYTAARTELAEVNLLAAEWRQAHGADPRANLRAAEVQLNAVFDPHNPRPDHLATRGVLTLIVARSQHAPEGPQNRVEACAHLRQAIQRNQWLRSRLEPYLGECGPLP